MILYGDDVFYDDYSMARMSIAFIDLLRINKPNINIKFATASEYFKAVLSENSTFSVFEGDFFPYVSKDIQAKSISWTGFYASRPFLKEKIYEAQSIVRAAEITSALIFKRQFQAYNVSLALHHNAITGTCRSQVVDDYIKRLSYDVQKSQANIREAYSSITTCSLSPLKIPLPYKAFVIYNPINWKLEKLVWIASEKQCAALYDNTGVLITSQAVPYSGSYRLYFRIIIKPLSFLTIFLTSNSTRCNISKKTDKNLVSNGIYSLQFNNGLIENLSTRSSEFKLMQQLVRYTGQYGGAYEFNPQVINI